MKKWICLVLSLLLLTGCAAAPGSTGIQLETRPTVEDIFTLPPTTTPATPTDPVTPTVPEVTEPTEPTTPPPSFVGTMNFGPTSKSEKDENGIYRVYDGGKMYLPFEVRSTGTIATLDVGILIFVDGIPQPYRVSPDGEYAYMHTFSQKDGKDMFGTIVTTADIYFAPITGEKGDMLEIYALCMLAPDHLPSQGANGHALTSGAVSSGFRLKYNATPPKDTYPEKNVRLAGVSTSVVDCTPQDIDKWTNTDMIENMRYAFRANGEKMNVYGVGEDDRITLRYEVWGTPYVHYGLVFFVDNEPVYAADLADIRVSVEMGRKTIIEATLDMTGFSGESSLYAVLVPRNYRTSEIPTYTFMEASQTVFLLAKEKGA
jgi:hypothetical protein